MQHPTALNTRRPPSFYARRGSVPANAPESDDSGSGWGRERQLSEFLVLLNSAVPKSGYSDKAES